MQKVVDTITIEKLEGGAFNVVQGDRYSDTLGYDEMLGLVSALTIAKEPNCLRWMLTKEEHEARRPKLDSDITEVEFEDILVPEEILLCRWAGKSKDDDGDCLCIGFNTNRQLLCFCNGQYNVITYHQEDYDTIQCKLIPCSREELKVGDTAFADLLNDFENGSSYCKVLDEEKVVFITPSPSNSVRVMKWNEPSLQWHKVVAL